MILAFDGGEPAVLVLLSGADVYLLTSHIIFSNSQSLGIWFTLNTLSSFFFSSSSFIKRFTACCFSARSRSELHSSSRILPHSSDILFFQAASCASASSPHRLRPFDVDAETLLSLSSEATAVFSSSSRLLAKSRYCAETFLSASTLMSSSL